MSLIWNKRRVNRPAINTKTQNSNLDLAALRALLDDGLTTFKAANVDVVAALASRLIACRAQSFRAQYGFKLLRKTNIALCRLNEINIVHVFEEFAGTIPMFRAANGKLEMPTRDNFDYVLMRLQSLAAIFLRIARCARESSTLFVHYISRNFFLENSVICVGVLAEVWDVARQMGQATIQFYNALYTYADHFGHSSSWLSSDTVFPERLEEFLGADWAAEWARGLSEPAAAIASNENDVAFDDFQNNADDVIVIDLPQDNEPLAKRRAEQVPGKSDEMKKPKLTPKVQLTPKAEIGKSPSNSSYTDIGQAVARKNGPAPKVEVVTKAAEPSRVADIGQVVQRKQEPVAMKLESVVSTDDVKAYVKSEKVRLTRGPSASMTLDRWNELQRKINHILVTSQGRNTVQMFKKFWSMAVLKKVL